MTIKSLANWLQGGHSSMDRFSRFEAHIYDEGKVQVRLVRPKHETLN